MPSDPEIPSLAQQPYRDRLLVQHLTACFGDIGPAAMTLLQQHLEWVEIAGGQTLMTQGDAGDSMYITVSGRLRAHVRGDDGSYRLVREISRGQIVGEMSLYTDAPRSATVFAIRDSVLVRLAKPDFLNLLATSAQVAIVLTRVVIRRLQIEEDRSALEKPVAMGVVAISDGVDIAGFGARFAAQLGRVGRVRVVDAAGIDAELRRAGIDEADAPLAIPMLLDEIEAANDFVLLLADPTPTEWTRRCSRHCDELLLLADATQPPRLHPIEEQVMMVRSARSGAAEILVMLHPADAHMPSGTAQWLARRPVADHVHVRPALDRDMARLARIQTRTAIGLVLAGGGARGFAHLGVMQALQERGIEVDCVGGTSIGSVMAAYAASDQPHEAVVANARRAFRVNPTGDYNLIPMLSLIKGLRLRRTLSRAVDELLGTDADLEDLWKNTYCVATNYSQASEHVIQRGNLVQSLLASISIPGALPPVILDGDLLCDGGSFNNFPVDVMRGVRGVGTVIGVDLEYRKLRRIEHDDMPGSWTLLRDRLRPRDKRRYRLPSLATYLVNVTVLYSASRRREALKRTDLCFNPKLGGVGMLDWDRFDRIVQQGHAHAVEVLDGLEPSALRRFVDKPTV